MKDIELSPKMQLKRKLMISIQNDIDYIIDMFVANGFTDYEAVNAIESILKVSLKNRHYAELEMKE